MTHASLFSGIGGPEVAAAMLGWDNVFHCEINPFGRQVLEYWFPNSDSYEDITKTDFTKYRGQIDVLTGGFPCQPFSYAGKRGGQADDRYLWPEMLRVIDEVRPTWVVGENVAGITTMVESCGIADLGGEASLFEEDSGVHRFRSEHTFTIERICRDLESKGYSVQPVLIPACAVGAPHRRYRVFIIAHNSDCGHDVRKPGEHEGESGEERISERNEVRKPGEPDNVRSKVLWFIEDSVCDGCWSGQKKEQRSQRNIGHTGPRDSERVCGEARADSSDTKELLFNGSESGHRGDEIGKEISKSRGCNRKTPADSDSRRGSKMDEHLQSELSDGTEPVCNGRVGNASDSFCEGLERQDESRSSEGGERMYIRRGFAGCRGAYGEGLRPEERWRDFPTVSPVHRGNDGLPFDVDDLAISFTKWRNESLKAYGNAIVPQVMYRIFQHIEKLTLF